MGYLLGARDGTTTSRYECFTRTPSLETALTCEAVLGVPVRELFAGLFSQVEKRAARRADMLSKRLTVNPGYPGSRKIGVLRSLTSRGESANSPVT